MPSVKKRSLWPSAATIALCVGLAAAALVLMFYHGAHLSNAWPLLLVLLCLGLHFFHHRRGGHGAPREGQDRRIRDA